MLFLLKQVTCNSLVLQIQQHAGGVFQQFLDGHQERDCTFSINDAVIIGQGEVHNRLHDNFTVYNHGALLYLVHTEYRALWWIQDRC